MSATMTAERVNPAEYLAETRIWWSYPECADYYRRKTGRSLSPQTIRNYGALRYYKTAAGAPLVDRASFQQWISAGFPHPKRIRRTAQ